MSAAWEKAQPCEEIDGHQYGPWRSIKSVHSLFEYCDSSSDDLHVCLMTLKRSNARERMFIVHNGSNTQIWQCSSHERLFVHSTSASPPPPPHSIHYVFNFFPDCTHDAHTRLNQPYEKVYRVIREEIKCGFWWTVEAIKLLFGGLSRREYGDPFSWMFWQSTHQRFAFCGASPPTLD